jgi:hypothetical protein
VGRSGGGRRHLGATSRMVGFIGGASARRASPIIDSRISITASPTNLVVGSRTVGNRRPYHARENPGGAHRREPGCSFVDISCRPPSQLRLVPSKMRLIERKQSKLSERTGRQTRLAGGERRHGSGGAEARPDVRHRSAADGLIYMTEPSASLVRSGLLRTRCARRLSRDLRPARPPRIPAHPQRSRRPHGTSGSGDSDGNVWSGWDWSSREDHTHDR